ncbi:hypothetical protein QE152_g21645 [Popillia japonica]|uniref:Uncharacterized protein n=1 Tax=Popillia japonica TaxID=7064 RepID=A0AAW1KMZ3_POPJA
MITQQAPESVGDTHTQPQPSTTSKEDQMAQMFEALCRRQDEMLNELKNVRTEQEAAKDELKSGQETAKDDLKSGQEDLKEELRTSQDNLRMELKNELQSLDTRIHTIQTQLCKQIDQLNTKYQVHEDEITQILNKIQLHTEYTQTHISELKEETQVQMTELKDDTQHRLEQLKTECHTKIENLEVHTIQNTQSIEGLGDSTKTIQERIEAENRHIHDTIAQLKRDLDQYRNQAPLIINGGQLVNTNTIKPEMWPKFKGHQDKVHAMTYLKNILR